MKRILAPILLMLGASSAHCQTPSETPAKAASPQQQPSLQQSFDQAADAEATGHCSVALPIFAKLAADPRVKPGTLPAGAIGVRRGICLISAGQLEAGESSLLAGLPILEKAGPSFDGDVANGEMALGNLAALQWNHDEAIAHFNAALAHEQGLERLSTLSELAKVSSFDGGPIPLSYVDEAIQIENGQKKPDKNNLATFYTIKGRILMNRGQNREALAVLKQALDLSGGLTSRNVTLNQADMRGDLAEAELLNGDKEQARLYLAYTGAGRIRQSPFARADQMSPPACGTETGLTRNDSAVVEFSIGDNGDVTRAQTVYSRGDYHVASAFARAVSEWYWKPESIAKIPQFYRALTRVELRCSTRIADQPDVVTPVWNRFETWASQQLGGKVPEQGLLGATLGNLHRVAQQAEQTGNVPTAVAALGVIGKLDPDSSASNLAGLDKALALAQQGKLPAEVSDALGVLRARMFLETVNKSDTAPRTINAKVLDFAHAPPMQQDALSQDTLVLLAMPAMPSERDRAATISDLTSVANDTRLADHHPLRQRALLQLANIAADAKNFEQAQSYFQRTGLTEQQCALIGAAPAMRSTGASSSDYPLAALSMGFEGWVALEFDITGDGKTADARAVVAYPPFVFVDAATGMARDIRYTSSYRPSGGEACSAAHQEINFVIPSNH